LVTQPLYDSAEALARLIFRLSLLLLLHASDCRHVKAEK
jgi:hypothetical protein